jgi:PAS domain S-box-containing protein
MDLRQQQAPVPTALIGVAGHDSGRILRANHAFAELVAGTTETVRGWRIYDVIHERDRARIEEAFSGLISAAVTEYEGDARLVATNGRLRFVTVNAALLSAQTRRLVLMRVVSVADQ